jgi:branched-chain amino acid transport system substrate-binding protein
MSSVRHASYGGCRRGAGRTLATRRGGALAVLLVGALLASACGSDDDADDSSSTATDAPAGDTSPGTEAPTADTSPSTDAPADETSDTTSDGPADTAASEPTGEPIKVMATGTIESAAFSLPTIPLGAQIAVDEINADGGINGRPLELVVCNDELDPNLAAGCVQQAAADGVVALVGGLSIFEPIVFPLLQTEGIPWVGAATASDFSTPILFPVGADGATAFSGIGAAAILAGCENPAIVISASGSEANTAAIRAGIEASGGTVAAELQATGPDFAPLIESALDGGADCIASGVSPAETSGLVSAVAGRVPISTVDGSLPEGLAAALGSAADGIHVVSGFRLPAAGDPNVVALAETSAAINPDAPIDNFWITGYTAVKILAEVLAGADEVSAEAVMAGLPGITDFDTGFGPVIDFSSPNPVPGFERIFNPDMYLWEVQDGKFTLAQEETLDQQPAIELLGQ